MQPNIRIQKVCHLIGKKNLQYIKSQSYSAKKIVYMFKTEKKLFNKIIFSLKDDLDIV